MCLIIVCKSATKKLPRDVLESVIEHNRDGWGISWKDPTLGRATCARSLHMRNFIDKFNELQKFASPEFPVVSHCRMATHGAVSRENLHPFLINDKGERWFLFHNGVLPAYASKTNACVSDTGILVGHLKNIVSKNHGILRNRAVASLLELCSGTGNRFVLVSPEGEATLMGSFHEDYDGFLLSNRYAYSRTPYLYGNNDSLISDINSYYKPKNSKNHVPYIPYSDHYSWEPAKETVRNDKCYIQAIKG